VRDAVPRVRYIDGLRAVAVLAVVLFHASKYVPALGLRTGNGAFTHPLSLGYHGVDLFFVLSGYCLAFPTIARLHNGRPVDFDVAHYLARRVARILPPYEIALWGFVFLLGLFAWRGWQAPADMLAPLDVGNVLRDTLLLDRDTTHVNQSFWSLAIEFRWYFIFPLALAVWIRFPRVLWLLIGCCVFASYATHAASTDVAYLPAFLLGIVAVDLELRRPPIVRFFPLLLIGALAAAFAFGLPAGVPVSIFWQVALFAFVVLAGCMPWLRAALSVPLLFEIGVASYSIYLVHQPLIALIAAPVARRIANPLFAIMITSAIGVAGGLVFWYVVERSVTTARAKGRLEALVKPLFDAGFEALRLPRRIPFELPLASTVGTVPRSHALPRTAVHE